jgi:hypothetical protein
VTAHLKPAELEAITPIVEQKVVNLALQGGGSHGAMRSKLDASLPFFGQVPQNV